MSVFIRRYVRACVVCCVVLCCVVVWCVVVYVRWCVVLIPSSIRPAAQSERVSASQQAREGAGAEGHPRIRSSTHRASSARAPVDFALTLLLISLLPLLLPLLLLLLPLLLVARGSCRLLVFVITPLITDPSPCPCACTSSCPPPSPSQSTQHWNIVSHSNIVPCTPP